MTGQDHTSPLRTYVLRTSELVQQILDRSTASAEPNTSVTAAATAFDPAQFSRSTKTLAKGLEASLTKLVLVRDTIASPASSSGGASLQPLVTPLTNATFHLAASVYAIPEQTTGRRYQQYVKTSVARALSTSIALINALLPAPIDITGALADAFGHLSIQNAPSANKANQQQSKDVIMGLTGQAIHACKQLQSLPSSYRALAANEWHEQVVSLLKDSHGELKDCVESQQSNASELPHVGITVGQHLLTMSKIAVALSNRVRQNCFLDPESADVTYPRVHDGTWTDEIMQLGLQLIKCIDAQNGEYEMIAGDADFGDDDDEDNDETEGENAGSNLDVSSFESLVPLPEEFGTTVNALVDMVLASYPADWDQCVFYERVRAELAKTLKTFQGATASETA